MMKKKIVSILLASVAVMSIGMTTAFAAYPTCTVSGCSRTRSHSHSGTTYAGHHSEDGHGHSSGRGHHSGGHH